MDVQPLDLPGLLLIRPKRIADARGHFEEVYRQDALVAAGVNVAFVQDNQSLSMQAGVIRGLHYQRPPRAQAKLIGCLRGTIRDVAVDIRHGSPTFGRHAVIDLSADNGLWLFVPAGFAHGFAVQAPQTLVQYKVSDYYDAASDRGLAFDDPALGIDWGFPLSDAILSSRDRTHPRLAELGEDFRLAT